MEDWRGGAPSAAAASGSGGAGGSGAAGGGAGGCATPCGGTCCPTGTTCSHGACTCLAGISAASNSTCALASSGDAWCWGKNDHGQLGIGSITLSGVPTPTAVALDPMLGVVAIAVGETHACALRKAGQVLCWGEYSSGQLGYDAEAQDPDSATRPKVPVGGLTDAVEIALGYNTACARSQAGEVRCWGSNTDGQLGVSPMSVAQSMVPLPIDGLVADQITLGSTHVCAVTGGSVECWGANGS